MEKNKQMKKMLVFLVVLFAMAVLIWGYNLFRLKEIQYEGLTRYTEEEFTERLTDSFLSTWTPFFCMKDGSGQEEIPFVEKYEVQYVDRNTARIVVHEKRVIGCIPIMGRYMYFDKDGIIVESSADRMNNIPIVDGLDFTEIVLYGKLQVQKQSLYDVILSLYDLIELNNLQIDKISFSPDYEVTLYTENFEIQLGKKTTYDVQMNALQGILKAAGDRSGILDMRNYSKENKEFILK